ncbi:MAG TPA: ATP-binding cassette domain-containing protein [Desulfomonilaceae bacterium]|nr:ATP-binding cassette domain-containing protein [Desulfomonilaceae bacterium]
MILVKHVEKHYGDQTVLRNLNLHIKRSTISAIVGGSGEGKTVLLRIMIGLEQPDSGSVFINDENIVGMRSKDLNRIRRTFGVLFQESALFDYLNVGENVAFPMREHLKLSEKEIKKQVEEKLAQVGLSGEQDKKVSELSGGMRKRVGLARALALQPDIIFFDEPTTGLDPVTAATIYDLIVKTAAERPLTYVLVTHDVQRVLDFTDEIFMIHHGNIISTATPQEIKQNPEHVIHRFMMGQSIDPNSKTPLSDA